MFVAILGLVLYSGFGLGLIFLSYDYLFLPRPRIPIDEVVMVEMDETSHAELHQPYNAPWDRSLHAKLLDRLTGEGARAVVFDIVFSDAGPNRLADEPLARAIRENGKVILTADSSPAVYGANGVSGWKITPPYELFSQYAAGIGCDELDSDPDQVNRRHFHGLPDDPLPSLSLATATLVGAEVTRHPETRFKTRWINYYRPPNELPNVSFYRALDRDAVPPGFFRNKVVFVGAHLKTLFSGERKDEYPTPYSRWGGEKYRFASGMEVHATMFLNLLRGDWLVRSPHPGFTERAVIILLGLLCGYSLIQLRPTLTPAVTLGAMLAIAATAYQLFKHERFWFPWLIPELQIFAAAIWSIVFNWWQLSLQKKLLEQSFALHLPPQRIKQVIRRPELLKPGAEKQMLSIMFTDIENFTRLSEGMDSDDVARVINEYFETTIPCIHRAEGTVIKLIGDAILAVWNAPDSQPNHRELACSAALLLNGQKVTFSGQQAGLKLRTRIGIHTGLANVGNFGSTTRIDYTAIGENVNLASRLEGLNKYLGTDILITRETLEGCSLQIVSRLAGHFRLKGFEKVVEVHALIGEGDQAEATRAWRETFERALKEFQQKNLEAAEAGFRCTLEMRPDDGPSKFYLQQIGELRIHPPAPDWAGEIELKEK